MTLGDMRETRSPACAEHKGRAHDNHTDPSLKGVKIGCVLECAIDGGQFLNAD